MPFDQVPSVYPQLLELRKSKTADFKPNSYLKESTKLRYYQVIGALHMILLNRMVLGDATGVGKTAMAIGAYSWILSREPTMKLLVVAPKSALFQWADEFDKFTQNISVRVLTLEYAGLSGIDARKKQYEDFKENVLIVGYAQIRSDYIFLKKALGANYTVIYDEATAFKGRKTQTYFAAQELAQSASRVYGLSATIIKNSLEEVWSIYSVIVPGLFGKITNFLRTYTHQKLLKLKINGQDRYIPQIDLTKGHLGHKNLEQFKKLIDPYILVRKKEEVESELPPIISKKVILEMEPDQKALYKKAVQGIIYEENVKRDFFEISDKVRAGTRDPKILEKYEDMKEKYEKLLTG
jgi:SNF2 family DNA or RNA helicase